MLKGNLVAYSGMTTKIRAMKNKLLSPEQYEEITHFTTVAELISFLQTTLHTEKYLPVWTGTCTPW